MYSFQWLFATAFDAHDTLINMVYKTKYLFMLGSLGTIYIGQLKLFQTPKHITIML